MTDLTRAPAVGAMPASDGAPFSSYYYPATTSSSSAAAAAQPSSHRHNPSLKALPSFAALNEHTARPDDVDIPDIASMSSRLACQTCHKVKPLVRDVAVAVGELDDTVQAQCNKTVLRVSESSKQAFWRFETIDRPIHSRPLHRRLTIRTITPFAQPNGSWTAYKRQSGISRNIDEHVQIPTTPELMAQDP